MNAKLIIADSESNADLFYATRFLAHDPLIFIEAGGKKMIIVSSLEFGRAKRQAKVDEVILSKAGKGKAIEEVAAILKKRGVKEIQVQESFAYSVAKKFEAEGFTFDITSSLFPERGIKTKEEVAWIEEAQRATEAALTVGLTVLRTPGATSESVRKAIDAHLFDAGYDAKETIVAGGTQAADPHEQGKGPLRKGETIVIDIFPRSRKTRYFADMTRTVCIGEPSVKLQKMYDAVLGAQELIFSMLKPGIPGQDIQGVVEKFFQAQGFPRTETQGAPEGFIHGVGHSVGLELHERPSINNSNDVLREGNVVTIEPGLYYRDVGGVRIEDIVLITKDGYRNLTNFPKQFVL
ncbi:aminopeptidase P family protein [Acetobacteraceae bacterium]|nr:aminopeptidase P family protein [Candidatus Parcubacteria bacterium]